MRSAALLLVFLLAPTAYAAEGQLFFSPSTLQSSVQETFEVRVIADTGGDSITAAEADLTYDPSVLEVVAVSTSESALSLWATEPDLTTAGIVRFSGWASAPISGSALSLLRVTFRTRVSGEHDVRLASGALLANDGKSSNILTKLGALTVRATPELSAGGGQVLGAQTESPDAPPPAPTLSLLEAVEGDRLIARGLATPDARVQFTITHPDGTETNERVGAGTDGAFTYVSDWRLKAGVYGLRAETYSKNGVVGPSTDLPLTVGGKVSTEVLAAALFSAPSVSTLVVALFSFILGFLLYRFLAR